MENANWQFVHNSRCLFLCTGLIAVLVCSMALIIGSVIAVLALVFFRRLVSIEYLYQL